MSDYIRDLHIFADGTEIAQGCHIYLEARPALTLRPPLHRVEIYDLSQSSGALLTGSGSLTVRSGKSILAFGEIMEVMTRRISGKRVTYVVFAPGLSLWNASVSLSVAGGLKVSSTMKALLEATGLKIKLASFTAEDITFSRPQAFFGRACDGLTLLAEAANADLCLSSAGLTVSGREKRKASVKLPESSLLSAPVRTGDRLILSTSLAAWPLGSFVEYTWQGKKGTGRLVSQLIQADNTSGPLKCELELETERS